MDDPREPTTSSHSDHASEASQPAAESHSNEGNVDIDEQLQQELAAAHARITELEEELESAKQKHLRGLAELQTVRRRNADEVKRAKDKGADSVVLAVLPVYDDLRRALEAASEDPNSIIPGIEKVRESLKRNLESIGIQETGAAGEAFDPSFHEALTTMPTEDAARKGTIAQVFESGFVKDARVVRPARVVVYQD